MREHGQKTQFGSFFFFLACLSLTGCSSTSPAPVTSLNNTYDVLEKGSYKGRNYVVNKGDTLYFISYITNQSIDQLIKVNRLVKPYTIYPGQILSLEAPKVVARVNAQAPISASLQEVLLTPPMVIPADPNAKTEKKTAKPPPVEKKVATNSSKSYAQTEKTNKPVTKKQIKDNKVSKWIWPVKGRIVGRFSNTENGNKGIDIAGKKGQSIVATAAGTVVYAGDALRGYGNLLIVKHNDTYLSAYAHNDQLLVREQQNVKAGQKIATMGNTGASDTKLHFEIRYRGKSVDPMRFLPK